MVEGKAWNVLDKDETEFRSIVFPGETNFNLLGKGFKQWQMDELKADVFCKLL